MQAGRLTSLALVALAALGLAGCKNRGELVEHELRARDIQYREALEEMGRIESHNQALQMENDALRGGSKLTPEQAAQTFGVKRIVLGRGTGGFDNDGLPGDEALQVIVEPRDAADHTIKSPGSMQVTALEINFQGVKVPIGEWTLGPDELRKSWKQTLLSTGYVLRLSWKTLPQSENVRIVARLILPDSRVYETDKDVRIRLVPGRSAPPPPREVPPLEALTLPTSHWRPAPADGIQLGRPIPQ